MCITAGTRQIKYIHGENLFCKPYSVFIFCVCADKEGEA